MKKLSQSFTLIEILVAVALGVVLMVSAYGIYFLATKTLVNTETRYEIRQNGRTALERMSRDLRQANEIISDLPETQTNPSTTEIKFQDGHDSTEIQYLDYYLKDNCLYKKNSHFSFASAPDQWVSWNIISGGISPTETIDSDQLVAENIDELNFWGQAIINISISVKKNQIQENYQTTVLGRNI